MHAAADFEAQTLSIAHNTCTVGPTCMSYVYSIVPGCE